jgi:hypothetical protein
MMPNKLLLWLVAAVMAFALCSFALVVGLVLERAL